MTDTTSPGTGLHISDLRAHLMNTLADLRDRTNPMDVDRARAVAQVASVLVDTAKVEVDFIKATGQDTSKFLSTDVQPDTPQVTHTPGIPGSGITSITRHRMGG